MKKITAFLMMAMICCAWSCKKEVKIIVEKPVEGDTQAPSDVSELYISETGDSFVTLAWTNPSDEDFFGTQISMEPAESDLEEPIIISKNKNSYTVKNLTNKKEYTLTLKTTDKKLNLSNGVQIKATPVYFSVPSVTNVIAAYNPDDKKISVSWSDRGSETSVVVTLKKDGTIIAEETITDTSVNSYDFTDIDSTEEVYEICVVVKDKDNNKGDAITKEVLTTGKPYISDVILSSKHVASGSKISFTVIGSRLNVLKSLKAEVYYKNELKQDYEIKDTINSTTGGSAVVSIDCPSAMYRTEGIVYTIKVYGIDENNQTITCSVVPEILVSSASVVAGISMADFIRADTGYTTLLIYGTNLDLLDTSNAIIKDSAKKQVSSTSVYPKSTDSEVLSALIPVPEKEGTYTLTYKSKELTFVVYAKVELEDVFVPLMGAPYAGNNAQIEIKGKNFKSTYFNKSYLMFAGAQVSDVVVKSDSYLIANIVCPENKTETSKTYSVKVMYEDSSVQKEFDVLAENACFYTPGDIIMQDGTRYSYETISAEDFEFTEEEKANIAGIVGGVRYGGADVIVIATTYSQTALLKTAFTSSTLPDYLYVASSSEGQNIWNYLCKQFPDKTADAATYYPGFNYANTYGSSFSGDYSSGWFVPSKEETLAITINHAVLKNAFSKAGKAYPNSTAYSFSFNIQAFATSSCTNNSYTNMYYCDSCRVYAKKYSSDGKYSIDKNYITFEAAGTGVTTSSSGTISGYSVSTSFSMSAKLYVLPVHKLVR